MTELATRRREEDSAAIVERVVIAGDLAKLEPHERVDYYRRVCASVGLNPLSRPFEYITLNNKLTLYARKDATDQLRRLHDVSITRLDRELVSETYVVTASARTPDGREDTDVGVVSVAGLRGEALANAMLKAITKAKRRVTLSICGLGWLDETEVETVPDARATPVNHDTGDILEAAPAPRPMAPAAVGDDVLFCTPAQVKTIYSVGREIGTGLEGTDKLSRDTYGKNPAQLSKRQASEFIDTLRGMGSAEAAPAPPAVQERRRYSRAQLIKSWRKGYGQAQHIGLAPISINVMDGGDSEEQIEQRIRELATWIKAVDNSEWPLLWARAREIDYPATPLAEGEDLAEAIAGLRDRLPPDDEGAPPDNEEIEVPF